MTDSISQKLGLLLNISVGLMLIFLNSRATVAMVPSSKTEVLLLTISKPVQAQLRVRRSEIHRNLFYFSALEGINLVCSAPPWSSALPPHEPTLLHKWSPDQSALTSPHMNLSFSSRGSSPQQTSFLCVILILCSKHSLNLGSVGLSPYCKQQNKRPD